VFASQDGIGQRERVVAKNIHVFTILANLLRHGDLKEKVRVFSGISLDFGLT
jgi:hypothetical protein